MSFLAVLPVLVLTAATAGFLFLDAYILDKAAGAGRPVIVIWKAGGEAVRYSAKVDRAAARIAAVSGGVDVLARVERIEGRVPPCLIPLLRRARRQA